MATVLAAISDDASAASVLATASMLARLLRADMRAVHAGAPSEALAAAARKASVPLDITATPPPRGLVEAARSPEVTMLVMGARSTPGGRRPAGRTALATVIEVGKPVFVVPPAARQRSLRRILVPLDGTPATAEALAATITLAREREIEVVVLHVHEEHAIPAFEDQAHHEREAWAKEFVARYCRLPLEDVRLEVRTGLPHQHVVEVARELDVDAVALGWRRDLRGGRAAVVREALARSPVPVLLVPLSTRPRSTSAPTSPTSTAVR